MNCSMLDVANACGSALGGIREILVIDPADMAGPALQFCEPSVPEVELLTGKRAYYIRHTLTDGGYSEKTNTGSRAGDFYESNLTFSVKKIRLDAEQLAERLRNRRVHVVFRDNNGLQRLMVNVRLTTETGTGNRMSERAGYRFTFTGRREKKNPLLLGSITSGTIDIGLYHIFFQDANNTWYHLTTDTDGTLVTTPSDPNLYNNVIYIAPPYGISVSELGALVTP